MIMNIVGFKGEIEWDSSKPDGLPREMFTQWNACPMKCLPNEMRSIFLWGEVYRGLTLFLRGTPQKLLDVSRINNLGWENKIELEKGIKRDYDWYKK